MFRTYIQKTIALHVRTIIGIKMPIEITFFTNKVDGDLLRISELFDISIKIIRQDYKEIATKIKEIKPDIDENEVKHRVKRRLFIKYKEMYYPERR